MDTDIQQVLTDFKSYLQDAYRERLSHVVLYGSHARGDAVSQASDIDVLIVLKGPVHTGKEIERTGNMTADLSLDSNHLISCLFMSENRFNSYDSALLRNIRREGISL